MKKSVLISLLSIVITYLSISFIRLSLNPVLWEIKTREAFVFISVASILVSYPISQIIELDKNGK